MKLIILAFILSLSLHFLIFSPFEEKNEYKDKPSTSKETKKSSVQYVRLMPKTNNVKKQDIKKEIKKTNPTLEKMIFKKVDKSKIKPQKKNTDIKKAKKIVPKPITKTEVRPTPTKQVTIKPQEKRKTIPNKSLENFLLTEPTPLDTAMLDDITKSYLKLYGEEYNSFTKVQKVYLQKNLKNIGRITQKYLRYPSVAVRTEQEGMNIVEFFLHPNGDISDLKLINSSGYTSLDKNSIETIEIAYKDYPRPKTKTKVKIYVYYKLY